MSRDEELVLVKKAQSGDTDAFEKLLTQHEKLVYNLALRTLVSEQDAQDATQEAFIKAWTSLASFRGESKFSVWLYRLANNVCIDLLRRRRSDTVSLTQTDSDGEEVELEIADESASPEKVLERKELKKSLDAALASLPEDYRRVLLLRENGDLSYEEIAQALDMDIGTVKSRIFRARKKLCTILSEDGNFLGNKPSSSRKGGVQA